MFVCRQRHGVSSWWFRYSLILFDEAATLSFPDGVSHAPGGQLLRFVRQHDPADIRSRLLTNSNDAAHQPLVRTGGGKSQFCWERFA